MVQHHKVPHIRNAIYICLPIFSSRRLRINQIASPENVQLFLSELQLQTLILAQATIRCLYTEGVHAVMCRQIRFKT
jgi:hypothetical protein